ncbi:hypothetical protein, partial [Collinsella tanakaei]|uniref:hypothetical protein n=1 Tax=Collinsella tanakaei TaxID=626935 RepID=UPI00195A9A99
QKIAQYLQKQNRSIERLAEKYLELMNGIASWANWASSWTQRKSSGGGGAELVGDAKRGTNEGKAPNKQLSEPSQMHAEDK